MKKIIITDDNRMVVESVAQLLPWTQLGFEIVAKAYDGVQALEALKRRGADIVISDIKMPNMDGLQLIREMKKLGLDAKTIVLSSYNDFDMVREAMRLGASEYILKTELDRQTLSQLLIALASQLDQEREALDNIGKRDELSESEILRLKEMDNELRRNRVYIRDQLLRGLCLGHLPEEQFLQQCKSYLEIRYVSGMHALLYLVVDNFQNVLDMRWRGDEQLLSFAAMNVVEELLDRNVRADLFYNGSGEFVVLACLESDGNNSYEYWESLFTQIAEALEQYFRIRISGGLSLDKEDHYPVSKLYVQALEASQFRYILGKGKLITDQDVMQRRNMSSNTSPNRFERVDMLRNALHASHPQLLIKTADSLMVRPEEVTPENFREALRLYEKYSFILSEFLEKNGLRSKCRSLLESFNEFLYDREAIPELNARFLDILRRISEEMATGNSHVRLLMKFVQAHYKEEITLQTASEQLGVNSAYLGRLVQKELQVNFSEYLNHYRIERAKELLLEGKLKIYEIAEAVGYGSTEHFSRMFKKVTGLSPKDYSSGKLK
ncbi:response regulator transcription factor [Paenibacillus roseipurpureus]|uniref:Response regulator n=1 Tax=Paenibacillus roseopurpureus TaxID=2918901 RepID=A0AA96RNV9_9BACL|nr:response regulator [Paenibacillus sp. MBLB1832]WNR45952.1 response regulator [Paenibacillus sp. MBLB1832]